MTSDLNIYQRRNAAKKLVYEHEFSKVKTEGLKYKYLPVEQVKPVVEDAWNQAGIVVDIVSTEVEDVREPWEKTSQYDGSTSTWFHMRMTLTFALVNVDCPTDRVEVTVFGEAKDNSDKNLRKLYTAALKNFYMIEFNIAEGPKDDSDATQSDDQLEQETSKRQDKAKDDPFFGKPKKSPAPKDPEHAKLVNELCSMMMNSEVSAGVSLAIDEAMHAAGIDRLDKLPTEVLAKIRDNALALKEVPQ